MEARKYSKKREAIYEALRNTTEHPSAEMLYTRLKPEYPDLSLGTVYRNLAMFVKDGSAVSVGTVAGQERYDAETRPHAHFICAECGSVLDVWLAQSELAGPGGRAGDGGSVTGHALSFSGTCRGCLKGQKTAT